MGLGDIVLMTDHGSGEGSQPLLEAAFPVGRLGDAIVGSALRWS
jgi:hypothetical protein